MGLIDPADENTLPKVQEIKAGMCIRCGHCEVFCPTQALLLNDRPDEKVALPAGSMTIAPDDMAVYLKKRRSVRSGKIVEQLVWFEILLALTSWPSRPTKCTAPRA